MTTMMVMMIPVGRMMAMWVGSWLKTKLKARALREQHDDCW